jgi:hypothetical protein
LYLKRADINSAIYYSIETRAALVEKRRRSELGIPRINGRAAGQQLMRERRAAVVLQRS